MNESHFGVTLIPSVYDFGRKSLGNSFNVSHIDALLTTAFLARMNCTIKFFTPKMLGKIDLNIFAKMSKNYLLDHFLV